MTEPHKAPEGSRFSEWRRRSQALQEALEGIFFGHTLGATSRKYMSF